MEKRQDALIMSTYPNIKQTFKDMFRIDQFNNQYQVSLYCRKLFVVHVTYSLREQPPCLVKDGERTIRNAIRHKNCDSKNFTYTFRVYRNSSFLGISVTCEHNVQKDIKRISAESCRRPIVSNEINYRTAVGSSHPTDSRIEPTRVEQHAS
jgi:hypothetical protein